MQEKSDCNLQMPLRNSEDAAKTGVSTYEDFDKLTDYSAVLRVNFSKVKEECTVEEMELK